MAEKILVVDDHAETLNLVSVILKRQGYEVHTANSGPIGLDLAEKVDPHLVLLDVMMPEMDGYEVCRRLRSHPTLNDVPVILFTAKSQPGEKWEGFQAGATDYLVKPTNTEELGKRVRTILDQSPRAHQHGQNDVEGDVDTAVSLTPPPKATKLVGVVGVRGGVGTTTAAINLAFCMAHTQHETILADLDMQQGHVGMYLSSKATESLNALATADVQYLAGELFPQLVPHNDYLRYLLSKPNTNNQRPVLEAEQMPYLARALQTVGGYVVMDLGHGITPTNQPILENLDRVVVCLRPERIAISAAKQLLTTLVRLAPRATIHVLMLEFGTGGTLPRKAVENFIGHGLSAEAVIAPLDMAQAVNGGKALVEAVPTAEAARVFRQLAHQILAS